MYNVIIITAVTAWAASQIFKVVFGLLSVGKSDLNRMYWRLIWAGGMPSSHSALTVSTLTIIGLDFGLNNPLFGLAFIIAVIAIYDRSRMNHIYKTFQARYPRLKKDVENDPALKDLVGHTFAEILIGTIIGLIVGTGIYYYIVLNIT